MFEVGIMVTNDKLSGRALEVFKAVKPAAKIDCFVGNDLVVSITHYELVPRHILLSQDEKFAFLKRYNFKESELPLIKPNDPIARYLGVRPG